MCCRTAARVSGRSTWRSTDGAREALRVVGSGSPGLVETGVSGCGARPLSADAERAESPERPERVVQRKTTRPARTMSRLCRRPLGVPEGLRRVPIAGSYSEPAKSDLIGSGTESRSSEERRRDCARAALALPPQHRADASQAFSRRTRSSSRESREEPSLSSSAASASARLRACSCRIPSSTVSRAIRRWSATGLS